MGVRRGDLVFAEAELGGMPPSAKPWKGEGPGVFELVEEYRGDAFRAVYTARFEKAVYVLHCFQKKSPRVHARLIRMSG